MKDFSITRIPNNDLIGLLFPRVSSLSDYFIEAIHPEYVSGEYWKADGTRGSYNACKRSVGVDVSKYNYVLLPFCQVTASAVTPVSGLSNYSGGQIISIVSTGSNGYSGSGYYEVSVTSFLKTACVTIDARDDLPIIGIMRRRNDNVNPRSPERPEPIEIRERQESEPEPETPEEVEEE